MVSLGRCREQNSLSQIPNRKVTAGILQREILQREKPPWLSAFPASPWWHLSENFPDLRKSHPAMTRSSHREQTQELDVKNVCQINEKCTQLQSCVPRYTKRHWRSPALLTDTGLPPLLQPRLQHKQPWVLFTGVVPLGSNPRPYAC